MSADETREAVAKALAAHRYALGHEGIMSDGEVAWLQCTCGWRETYEMPEDDIRLAETRWDAHLAEVLSAGLMASGLIPEGTTTDEWAIRHDPNGSLSYAVGPGTPDAEKWTRRVAAMRSDGVAVCRTRTSYPDRVTDWEPDDED